MSDSVPGLPSRDVLPVGPMGHGQHRDLLDSGRGETRCAQFGGVLRDLPFFVFLFYFTFCLFLE